MLCLNDVVLRCGLREVTAGPWAKCMNGEHPWKEKCGTEGMQWNRCARVLTKTTMCATFGKDPLILSGNVDEPAVKAAMELLDRSGLDYKHLSDGVGGGPALTSGKESCTSFSKRDLTEFLWNHGAKFEDS
jgi:hypothetical protein